jgi:nucleoid-associated protein YgaU
MEPRLNYHSAAAILAACCFLICGCETKPKVKGPIPPGDYVVVDKEDNLNNISLRAYGDMKFWWGLLNANPDLTKRPGFDLVPGETIQVPKKDELNMKLPKSVFPKQLPADYIVMPGDTLPVIAKSCYCDRKLWKRIYQANRNVLSQQVEKNPALINAGQVLHLPAKEDRAAEEKVKIAEGK